MDQNEFEEKYNFLNSKDMSIVSEAINGMEDEIFTDNMPEDCSARGNPAYPDCKLSYNMFDDQ